MPDFFDELHIYAKYTLLMDSRHSLGWEGENLACELLLKKGYQILYRNYRFGKAEIDIVACCEPHIVFVEVKSRTTKWVENLAELVSKKQRRMLVQAADHYIITQDIALEARFDIITIWKTGEQLEIEHLKNAFYHF